MQAQLFYTFHSIPGDLVAFGSVVSSTSWQECKAELAHLSHGQKLQNSGRDQQPMPCSRMHPGDLNLPLNPHFKVSTTF